MISSIDHLVALCDYAGTPGRVPKWSKGTDCKSVSRGFESHLGLSEDLEDEQVKRLMNPEQPAGFGFFHDRAHWSGKTLVSPGGKNQHLSTRMRSFNHVQS
jgi:hypothetical protein